MLVSKNDWVPSPGITVEGTALEIVKADVSQSVLAGPGAGKTELLAQRATYLLNTGACPSPKRILALAFKVDAARNLQNRVEQRCESESARRFESLTLHAFSKKTLDQFREALTSSLRPSPDYRIFFPNRDTLEEFQRQHAATFGELRGLNLGQFLSLVHSQVPDLHAQPDGDREGIAQLWWAECLQQRPSALTFDMMILLATHIVQTQAVVRNAIRNTYTHVFLDEFQDVTAYQYELVRSIFQDSSSIVTAVGDTNQGIMKWAGALPDVFDVFNNDFAAENRKLLFNFRSNFTIVTLINELADLFTDDKPVRTESARGTASAREDAIEGWVFPSRSSEGVGLADFVQKSLSEEADLRPHDFVILARLRANDVEERLHPYFAEKNLRLRNEARSLGPISIQELSKDPIFNFLTALLKMAHGQREGSPFQVCRDMLASLEGIDLSTDRGAARSLRAVQDLVASVKRITSDIRPANLDGERLASIALPPERRELLVRSYNEYNNLEYIESIIQACVTFYEECKTDDWPSFLANVEGKDVVRIMTIHKSKGLEYHTVIFTEFNDDAFWNNDDDVNVFFVALSRARERIRFSLTKDSRGFVNVRKFLEKLQSSGVKFMQFD